MAVASLAGRAPAPGAGAGAGARRGDRARASASASGRAGRAPRRALLLAAGGALPLAASALGAAPAPAEEGIPLDADVALNAVLSAYGLPRFRVSPRDFRTYDVFNNDYTFEYPRSWVGRPNRERPGCIFSDFNTADQLKVEAFRAPAEAGDDAFLRAAVDALVVPPGLSSGDSKLEAPDVRRVRSESRDVDGTPYTYIAFVTNTTTRSGYDVKRKHLAVAARVRGQAYVLGTSVRSDMWSDEKAAQVIRVVESFRVR